MSIKERRRRRNEKQRRWREKHPVMAAWYAHLYNAKARGIAVEWTFEEFHRFCTETGYHILRRDGFQMHRLNDIGSYAYGRVEMLSGQTNRWLQDFYRRLHRNAKDASQLAQFRAG